jgi:hexosaminidase
MHTRSRFALAAVSGCIALAAGCRGATVRPSVPTPGRVLSAADRLVPAPASLTVMAGEPFIIGPATTIAVISPSPEVLRTAEMLALVLRPSTGFAIPVSVVAEPAAGSIVLRQRAGERPASADHYELTVSRTGVEIAAVEPVGIFRGMQTLRQLLPPGIERQMKFGNDVWTIPPVSISDQPRFAWRGAMLDVSRHFFTVREVQQYVDILALYKMNVLHLHLSDDQGWRIEIKSRPKLTGAGSVTQVGGGPGGFYTQEDYAAIVRYAQERYVTIVPEIDMPGHTNAALVGHPEVSCGKRPPELYTGTEVGFSTFCVEKEETYALIDDIVREVAAITPGPWFHMGGDEVETLSPAQYAAFVERVQDMVTRHGKQLIGWEEINKARLRPTSIIQQWRGDTLSVQSGRKMIMSPGRRLYLDMKYEDSTELGHKWAGAIDVRQVYDWDPATYNPGVGEPSILGVEAPIWSETVRNITAVQYLAMPRIPAVAEVGWTAQSRRDWESFRRRLATHAPRWNYLGINFHRSRQIPW